MKENSTTQERANAILLSAFVNNLDSIDSHQLAQDIKLDLDQTFPQLCFTVIIIDRVIDFNSKVLSSDKETLITFQIDRFAFYVSMIDKRFSLTPQIARGNERGKLTEKQNLGYKLGIENFKEEKSFVEIRFGQFFIDDDRKLLLRQMTAEAYNGASYEAKAKILQELLRKIWDANWNVLIVRSLETIRGYDWPKKSVYGIWTYKNDAILVYAGCVSYQIHKYLLFNQIIKLFSMKNCLQDKKACIC